MLEGLRGEDSIAELCRKEGSTRTSITDGPRSFWKPARSAWRGRTRREATSDEVKDLQGETRQLKEAVAEVL